MNTTERDAAYVAHTYNRFPVQLVRGAGAVAYDEQGKRYIDLGAGIAVNTFGFCDPVWADAVAKQAHTLQHTSNLYYTEPCTRLAEKLCCATGMKKVFFSNSGAEANECAIKVARRFAYEKYGDESHATVITLKNSFHGRTITTLAATGQDVFHTWFGPFTPGFVYADPDHPEELHTLAEQHGCCAIMLEVVQGEGGVRTLSPEFLEAVHRVASVFGLLIIVDEVQTGNGRTGTLFAYMQTPLRPDIVTTAKGLAGGLPLGATLLGPRVEQILIPGSHGSTFGGNPVAAAGALSILDRLTGTLLADVRRKSAYIRTQLEGAPGVGEISGLGLMLGVLPLRRTAAEIAAGCLGRGVLVLTAKDRIRLLPPLNIDDRLLKEAITVLKGELAQ